MLVFVIIQIHILTHWASVYLSAQLEGWTGRALSFLPVLRSLQSLCLATQQARGKPRLPFPCHPGTQQALPSNQPLGLSVPVHLHQSELCD